MRVENTVGCTEIDLDCGFWTPYAVHHGIIAQLSLHCTFDYLHILDHDCSAVDLQVHWGERCETGEPRWATTEPNLTCYSGSFLIQGSQPALAGAGNKRHIFRKKRSSERGWKRLARPRQLCVLGRPSVLLDEIYVTNILKRRLYFLSP